MYIHKQLCIGVRVRVHIYELKNLELTLSKNEQRKKKKKNSERLLRSNKITIAAKQSRQVVAAERATRIERERQREWEQRALWRSLLQQATLLAYGREGVSALRSPYSGRACAIGAPLSFSVTLSTNVIQNVFSKRYSHTQLTCEEVRQGDAMRCKEKRAERRRALIRAANLNAI